VRTYWQEVKPMGIPDPQPAEPRKLRLVDVDSYPSWEEVYRDNAPRV